MYADFIRKKPSIVLIFMLLCGIFLIGFYFFLSHVDPVAVIGSLTFLVMGVVISAVSILAMLSNRTAFIHLKENSIEGRYHLFGKINCPMDEVAFVAGQFTGLDIFMKDGKRHSIVGLSNPEDIASYILRQIFTLETEAPDAIRCELTREQHRRKKMLILTTACIVMLIINIFIAALLTGMKDMNDFSRLDWTLFCVMGVIEIMTFAALIYFANTAGKALMKGLHLRYRLQGACIASQPLPTQAKHVYTDEHYTGRAVVCGYPNDESVFYCIQEFGEQFELETVFHSEVYENEEALFADTYIRTFFDISEHFC